MLRGAIATIERELEGVDELPVYAGLLDHGKLPAQADPDAEITAYHFSLDPDISVRLDLALGLSHSGLTRGHVVELCIGELTPVVDGLDMATVTSQDVIDACASHCRAIGQVDP
jgi:hypothetical protein